ncbi:MAG: hypothetical protein J5786_00840 [Clostridiales bacterium]|nr:hypothetical protein [Clostridiales bacterium]
MKESEDKQEYIKIIDTDRLFNRRGLSVCVTLRIILFFSTIFGPVIVAFASMAILEYMGVSGLWAKILPPVLTILALIFFVVLLFAVAANKINLPGDLPTKKYYLNVPKAYEKVNIVPLTDGSVTDRLYLNGALVFNEGYITRCPSSYKDVPAETVFSYIYNIYNDNYDLGGKDLTIYKIKKEDLLSHYTFLPDYHIREDVYLIPLEEIGISPEEYRTRKEQLEKEGKEYRIIHFGIFADLVDYRDGSYGNIKYYRREEARKYFSSLS